MELLLVFMVGIGAMMFFTVRKQKRMVSEQQHLQDSLAEGDRVMTTSGMYATVADASDDTTIDLEIADGVVTTWLRQAVRQKVGPVLDDEIDELDTDELDTDEAAESTADASLERGSK